MTKKQTFDINHFRRNLMFFYLKTSFSIVSQPKSDRRFTLHISDEEGLLRKYNDLMKLEGAKKVEGAAMERKVYAVERK